MAEKQVRAPFAGRLGIRQVDLGQYLAAGTQIVTLQQLNPLYVDFYLPQQALARSRVGQKVNVGDRCVSRPGISRHRFPRSMRWSTPRPAACRCAPRCPTMNCCSARACSRP